jgi:ABC-2 type transport system permease protein
VPTWLDVVMHVNPVFHALNIIRAPFYGVPADLFGNGGYLLSLAVTLAWVAISMALSIKRVSKRELGAALA